MIELILISTISTGIGIGIGVFFSSLRSNFIKMDRINEFLYSIHYRINNDDYSIIINSKSTSDINFPELRDINGYNITDTIKNYYRGANSVIPKDRIFLKYLKLNRIIVKDTDVSYVIGENSLLFGLSGK
jgi:hypothetical protein